MSEVTGHSRATPHSSGYRNFALGGFVFSRDEHFVHIAWRAGGARQSHILSADAFLRALMRDVAWDFFYGWVNFDAVFGTRNLYGRVEVYAGSYQASYSQHRRDYSETFDSAHAMAVFSDMLADWTNEGYDPFAAPAETTMTWAGPKRGSNAHAVRRRRSAAKRMLGLPGDLPLRSEASGADVNRAFADVPQDAPEIEPEPGFESQLHAVNLFAYLSRADATWNPSVVSVCGDSLFCPTTEEHILPVKHANDRIEWFLQLSDEIEWDTEDRATGSPRARVLMRAGDVAAMPADIRHQGYARKRSMLLVWENANPRLPALYASGALPPSLAHEVETPTQSSEDGGTGTRPAPDRGAA